jgi:DNA-binding LacI/PurR family transcriptional regulator
VSPITVYDVAAKAEVSISTVSRVLNAPDKVNDATRVRVLAAIDSLGFVPKAEAAARARKGSGRIGVLAPFFTLPSFVERLRGVANAVADSVYELAIYSVDSSSHRDGYLASLPLTRRIDGLIVMALPFDESATRRLVANDLATVLIEFSQEPFSSIRIDDRAGGRLAAQFLLDFARDWLKRACRCQRDISVWHRTAWKTRDNRRTICWIFLSRPRLFLPPVTIRPWEC